MIVETGHFALVLAFVVAIIAALAALALAGPGSLMAALGVALAAWLATAVAVEWAERVRLFRAPLGESAQRALRLPRSAARMVWR